jgi:myosin heavy subunit
VLKHQFCNIQAENKELKESLNKWETQARLMVSESEWQQKLEDAEKARQAETTRANNAVFRTTELEKQIETIQNGQYKVLEEKNQLINELQKNLEEAKTANHTYTEQIEEFERYIVSQESQLTEKERSLEEVNRRITEQQEEWSKEKSAFEQQLDEIRKISEQRRLDIYVVESKLMRAESENRATITDLRKELQTAQYVASITRDKVQHIIGKHRNLAKKMIDESLAQGWKLWTAQAAELQLLRADKNNRQVQGAGFFKMAQKDIDNIQEDIMKDMDEIAAFYREEIQRIMQEFDKNDIGTSVQLDKIEAERTSKTPGLQAPGRSEPEQPTESQHSKPAPNDDCDTDEDEDEEEDIDGIHPRPEEPSIFDILNDSDEELQE